MGLTNGLEMTAKLDSHGALITSKATERLRTCEALLDGYAKRVFDAHAENR